MQAMRDRGSPILPLGELLCLAVGSGKPEKCPCDHGCPRHVRQSRFPAERYYILGDDHFSAEGNQLVFRELARRLL